MRDGIYKLSYQTATLNATGAIVLSGGAVSGADRHYFMFGRYHCSGNKLAGAVTFKRHTLRDGLAVLIPPQFELVFEGLCGDNFGQFAVHCPALPFIKGNASFTWIGRDRR